MQRAVHELAERPAPVLPPDHFLNHVPEHGVVICRDCQFAIQPTAFSSHLQRHHILRSERRRILEQLSRLQLLAPDMVPPPPPGSPAIDGIPVYSGHRCMALRCAYSCVSLKRMSQHWSEQHGQPNSQRIHFRPAQLQTFFRGTKIRYFEVLCPAEHLQQALNDHAATLAARSQPSTDAQGHATAWLAPRSQSPDSDALFGPDASQRYPYEPAPSNPARQAHQHTDLDMDALMYLHHYVTASGFDLSHGTEPPDFWTHTIPREAARNVFLMYGLLGTAAFHLALSHSEADGPAANDHVQAALRYQNKGVAGFRVAVADPTPENSTALMAFGRMLEVQKCVEAQLRQDQPLLENPALNLLQITEFLGVVHANRNLMLAIQSLLPVDSAAILPEDVENGLDHLEQHYPSALFDSPNDLSYSTMPPPQPVGPMNPFLPYSDAHDNLPPQVNALLTTLPARLSQAFELSAYEAHTLRHSITALHDAVSVAYSSGAAASPWPLWNGAEGWVRSAAVQGGHGLLSLLESCDPAALVVFGHWCALLIRRLEGRYWFLGGLTVRLLRITIGAAANRAVGEMLSGFL